ncbi:MAG TPA: HD domain-containing phosphohydrolase [Anaerovoracaceae bacterium]|nr:HD domain-containing phosphohydrolase [Anaerovoracaceae bacterium]
MSNIKKVEKKLLVTAGVTVIAFTVSLLCLSNGIFAIYQNLFYIPIICSCFWYRRKGYVFSIGIGAAHFLFFLGYNPEPLWEELVRLIAFTVIGYITYRLSENIRNRELKITALNKKLRNDLERFNKAEILSHLGNYKVDLHTGKIEWSDELYRIFGFEPKSFEPTIKSRADFTYSDDKYLVDESIEKVIHGKCSFNKMENRIIRQDGSIRWVLSTGHIELDDHGAAESYIGTLLDITERKQLEKSLEREKERLRMTIASIGDGVISTDTAGNITILNKVAEQLTGWTQEEALGRPIEEIFDIVNENTGIKCDNPIHRVLESGLILGLANHTALIAKDGTARSIADSAAPIKDSDGEVYGVILVFRDITEEKHRQDEIYYMSYYDSLTGLYNRRYIEEEFKRIDTTRNLPISIIMGDANGLKLTNDAFGHSKGDKLLINTAKAIKSACRAEDIAARWGGDEFVVLLPKTKGEEAELIVKRIKNACSKMKIGSLNVSVSLGWDTKESKDQELLKVLKGAEDHMYKHKVSESGSVRGNIINAIFHTIHEKNPKIESHLKRVSLLCQQIGAAMNLSETEIDELKLSGLLHDIGKVAIDDGILQKTGLLTEQELIEIKRHSDIGYRILNTAPEMTDIASYVLSHHERFDGTGYPRGMKQGEIPLISRIIAVADAYDAMTNERPYKKVLDHDSAVKELEKNKGLQFDPVIVDIFIKKVVNNQ